jgi:outer membrane receptor protein involved in Fe transport
VTAHVAASPIMQNKASEAAGIGASSPILRQSRYLNEISAVALLVIASPSSASSQEALPTIEVGAQAPAPRASATTLPQPVTNASNAASQPKAPDEASSVKIFTGAEVNAIPFTRPGEALEIAPGLVVTQHSGEGKANQYFLRGFNLDHGSDLALFLDETPLNMRTHGHAQGYADANFLIPELLSSVVVRKGPYFADEGDFSSAGAVHMQYVDKLDKGVLLATGGGFAYGRLLSAKSYEVSGGNLLAALETNVYNGPWTRPDDLRKINGVMRWSQGSLDNGLSITGMAYANRWYSTDQIPKRAVNGGIIPMWGNIDRADGGDTTRFSLASRWSETDETHASRVDAYVMHSTLNLHNNFTYFLGHPDLGDQFRQFDRRTMFGFDARHAIKYDLAGFSTETRVGLQGRYDNIRLGINETWRRQPYDALRNDNAKEASVALWIDTTVRWTPWLRATAGFRVDYFNANVNSIQDALAAPKDESGAPIWTGPFNSGMKSAAMMSPKAGAVLGPFYKTELFINFGEGFHSTDARGTVQNLDPTDSSRVGRIPLLVKSRGAEIGARTNLVDGLNSSISFFWLNFDSENQFTGDTGTTIFGRPSRRYGVEIANHYSPTSWLRFDGDLALTHARFRGVDQLQTLAWIDLLGPASASYGAFYGNAPGDYLTNAPNIVASGGLEIGENSGWFAGLRYRYFGVRPLTEDGAFKSPALGVVNARIGYRFDNGWRVQADAFNIFNSRSDQITYAYGSLLPTDPLFGLCRAGTAPGNVCAIGVMDRHLHPIEPPAVRVTVGGTF